MYHIHCDVQGSRSEFDVEMEEWKGGMEYWNIGITDNIYSPAGLHGN
jgi:hypothetical protein